MIKVYDISKMKKRNAKIMESREKQRQASLELLEIDSSFAFKIKNQLQNMIFTKYVVTFLGVPSKKEISSRLIAFYLEVNHRIHIKEENVSIQDWLCYIKLNDEITAKVPIKNGTGIKSVIPYR